MGNNRGNYYSDQHATLSNKSKEYWNFDFEDMGTSDQPAFMDYITKATGQEKLTYIGNRGMGALEFRPAKHYKKTPKYSI